MIRQATKEDTQSLFKLTKYALGYENLVYEQFIPRIEIVMDNPEHTIYVFEYNQQIVGYIHA